MSAYDTTDLDSAFINGPYHGHWFTPRQTGDGWGTTPLMTGSGGSCAAVYTYYQRVFDDTNIFWCYYSGSAVDPTPGITDTTPNNSGNISGHNIITITSEIVCS